ncbi:MAG: TetR/AcrR family transcriptional regulator [Geodermatophilaceae bacterium]|nr:TetR/AcrR family transcriptional regulator [Geodermatophilaceae bacterium]
MSTRDAQAERTRRDLLRVARELFVERGYARVGTEEIVARAGLTRGALYHHFPDKQALFAAVHEQLEQELVAGIAATISEVADPVERLEAGIRSFLDACTDRQWTRITLLDAPTVLGWATWRETDQRYGLGLVSAALAQAMDSGALIRQPVRPLAHIMIGALGEAALLIANAEDPDVARAEVEPILMLLVRSLRS